MNHRSDCDCPRCLSKAQSLDYYLAAVFAVLFLAGLCHAVASLIFVITHP